MLEKYKKNFEAENSKKEWWTQLMKRLEGYKLSSEEQDVIKKEILHKECEMHRKA